jgi:hypothetical protein
VLAALKVAEVRHQGSLMGFVGTELSTSHASRLACLLASAKRGLRWPHYRQRAAIPLVSCFVGTSFYMRLSCAMYLNNQRGSVQQHWGT